MFKKSCRNCIYSVEHPEWKMNHLVACRAYSPECPKVVYAEGKPCDDYFARKCGEGNCDGCTECITSESKQLEWCKFHNQEN